MNARALAQQWNPLRPNYGVYLRLIDAIPEADLHAQLVPGIRTPARHAYCGAASVLPVTAR